MGHHQKKKIANLHSGSSAQSGSRQFWISQLNTVSSPSLSLNKKKISHLPYKNTQTKLLLINPFEPEFTIVIFIHYKPRIAVAILDL